MSVYAVVIFSISLAFSLTLKPRVKRQYQEKDGLGNCRGIFHEINFKYSVSRYWGSVSSTNTAIGITLLVALSGLEGLIAASFKEAKHFIYFESVSHLAPGWKAYLHSGK